MGPWLGAWGGGRGRSRLYWGGPDFARDQTWVSCIQSRLADPRSHLPGLLSCSSKAFVTQGSLGGQWLKGVLTAFVPTTSSWWDEGGNRAHPSVLLCHKENPPTCWPGRGMTRCPAGLARQHLCLFPWPMRAEPQKQNGQGKQIPFQAEGSGRSRYWRYRSILFFLLKKKRGWVGEGLGATPGCA